MSYPAEPQSVADRIADVIADAAKRRVILAAGNEARRIALETGLSPWGVAQRLVEAGRKARLTIELPTETQLSFRPFASALGAIIVSTGLLFEVPDANAQWHNPNTVGDFDGCIAVMIAKPKSAVTLHCMVQVNAISPLFCMRVEPQLLAQAFRSDRWPKAMVISEAFEATAKRHELCV